LTGSPFRATVTDTAQTESPAANVRCYGTGLEPKGVRPGQPATFTVDASKATVSAPIEVTITDVTTGIQLIRVIAFLRLLTRVLLQLPCHSWCHK